jgi:hypothetical protein
LEVIELLARLGDHGDRFISQIADVRRPRAVSGRAPRKAAPLSERPAPRLLSHEPTVREDVERGLGFDDAKDDVRLVARALLRRRERPKVERSPLPVKQRLEDLRSDARSSVSVLEPDPFEGRLVIGVN